MPTVQLTNAYYRGWFAARAQRAAPKPMLVEELSFISVQGHADGVGASARFAGPTGLTVDNQQHIVYVADGTTIRAVAADGTVTTVVGSKAGLVDGDGCAARFGALQGITYFAGALYAVDINRIRKVTLP